MVRACGGAGLWGPAPHVRLDWLHTYSYHTHSYHNYRPLRRILSSVMLSAGALIHDGFTFFSILKHDR